MTAPDHTTKPFKNTLRERGHPYMGFCGAAIKVRMLLTKSVVRLANERTASAIRPASSASTGARLPRSTTRSRRVRQRRRHRVRDRAIASGGFRGSSRAGRLVHPGPDPMQVRSMGLQPSFGGLYVFGKFSHDFPERGRMVHVHEVRDLMRR